MEKKTTSGLLIHKPGGAEHACGIFDYDPEKQDDDEIGYLFGAYNFTPGEYVSANGADGDMHTFIVASVRSLPS
jgi:hypothetical protein